MTLMTSHKASSPFQPTTRIVAGILLSSLLSILPHPVQAQGYEQVYSAQTQQYNYMPLRYNNYQPKESLSQKFSSGVQDIWRSSFIKKSIVGAGAGLGVAALAERNLLRGSLIGAGVGASLGVMDNSPYFNQHPLVRHTSKGALIGVGAAAATSAAALFPAAAVGAGIGAGIHYVKSH